MQSWVPNKSPPTLLVFEYFFQKCLIGPVYLSFQMFLLTCIEIEDLNTNIPISNFINKYENSMWKKIYILVVWYSRDTYFCFFTLTIHTIFRFFILPVKSPAYYISEKYLAHSIIRRPVYLAPKSILNFNVT